MLSLIQRNEQKVSIMANIIIRDLPDTTKHSLRVHAAQSGLSLEAYARYILQVASKSRDFQVVDLLELASKHFGVKGGVDVELPKRQSHRRSVDFDAYDTARYQRDFRADEAATGCRRGGLDRSAKPGGLGHHDHHHR